MTAAEQAAPAVESRTLWRDGPASPADVVAYTRSGAWIPGEQAPILEFLGKAYGWLLALPVTVAGAAALWVLQRPSRLGLVAVLALVLWATW
ncbi:hypothetical protein [Pseudonocardia asaccharolytica]|nr:hypothetical protein [Pseudonocardia asaccharolytica]